MSPEQTKLEAETREEIDKKLIAAGWVIQDKKRLNLHESLGVAVREMDTDTGPADYMLFIDGKACGIVETKREGASLGACNRAISEPADMDRHIQSLDSCHKTAGDDAQMLMLQLQQKQQQQLIQVLSCLMKAMHNTAQSIIRKIG